MSLCRGSFLVVKFWYQNIAAFTVISVYRKSFGKMKAFGEDHTVAAVCRSDCAGEQLSIPHEHPRTLDIACGHFLLTIRTIHRETTPFCVMTKLYNTPHEKSSKIVQFARSTAEHLQNAEFVVYLALISLFLFTIVCYNAGCITIWKNERRKKWAF